MADLNMPVFNQPIPGQGIPAPQSTYPVQNGSTQAAGSSGGLVNRAAQIQSGVQNGLNMANQGQQMDRATQNYNEGQARNKGMAVASGPNANGTPPSGDGHADFMQNVLQGLHSVGAGVARIFGGGQGAIPTPAPAPTAQNVPAPAAMEDGGPVTPAEPEVKKSTTGDLLIQAAKEAGRALFGSGAGAKAADASRNAVEGAQHQVDSYMDGGPIRSTGVQPQFVQGPITQPQPTVLAFAQGGAIPASSGGGMGVISGGTEGIQGFQDGGLVNQSAQVQAGVANGQNMVAQGAQMDRAAAQYTTDQNGRAAKADASMPPHVAQAHLAVEVDQLHQDMLDHSLGDDDKPNNSRALPAPAAPASGAAGPAADAPGPQGPAAATPAAPQGAIPAPAQGAAPPAQGAAPQTPPSPDAAATASAVQDAATSQVAQTGQITTTPAAEGKPHSITTATWDDWDNRIDNAVRLAALAGQDPGQVRSALEANRNAYIQGHVLRYLSAANVNMLNGDQKGVEAALKNAYYYMPDGQDLSITKDKQGNLMYQDPVNPTVKGPDGKVVPNMVPVDAAHIQLLGQAMLDPMQVNSTLMNIRNAQRERDLANAKIALERDQGTAALNTSEGNLRKGTGIYMEGQSHLARDNAQNYRDLAEGDAARIRANAIANRLNNTVRQNKLDPQLLKGANDAGDMFEHAAQGQLTTIQGDPLTNPNVGKTTRDPTKSTLPKATPEDIAAGKALAGQIFLGGGGQIPPAEAARLATLAQTAKRGSHPGPDGKPMADFYTDPKTGDSHVWNKAMKKWEAFRLPLTSSVDAASGNLGLTADDLDEATKADALGGNSGGQGAIPTSSPQMANAKGEGDMEDQKFPDES